MAYGHRSDVSWASDSAEVCARRDELMGQVATSGVIPGTTIHRILTNARLFGLTEGALPMRRYFLLDGLTVEMEPGHANGYATSWHWTDFQKRHAAPPVPELVVRDRTGLEANGAASTVVTLIHEAQHDADLVRAEAMRFPLKTLADRVVSSRFLEANARVAEFVGAINLTHRTGDPTYLGVVNARPALHRFLATAGDRKLRRMSADFLHGGRRPPLGAVITATRPYAEGRALPPEALRAAFAEYFVSSLARRGYDTSFVKQARSLDASERDLSFTFDDLKQMIALHASGRDMHFLDAIPSLDLGAAEVMGPLAVMLREDHRRRLDGRVAHARVASDIEAATIAGATARTADELYAKAATGEMLQAYENALDEIQAVAGDFGGMKALDPSALLQAYPRPRMPGRLPLPPSSPLLGWTFIHS